MSKIAGMESASFLGGIDLGGTKILSLVVDDDLEIAGRDYRLTEAAQGLDAVVQRMVDSLRAAAGGRRLRAVGISTPGPCDVRRGIVTSPPNLPGWKDVPLAKLIGDAFGLPAWIENDGNAGAIAEHRVGAGKGFDHVILVTLGTGIGGGLILDGRIYHGASGSSGEIGHMKLTDDGPACSCGRRGCLEALASGRYLGELALAIVKEEPRGILARLTPAGETPTAETLSDAAAAGDERAREAIARAGGYLAEGIVNLVDIFNPQQIVLAGSLRKLGPLYLDAAFARVKSDPFPQSAADVELVEAMLEDDAAAIGAAIVAMDRLSGNVDPLFRT